MKGTLRASSNNNKNRKLKEINEKAGNVKFGNRSRFI